MSKSKDKKKSSQMILRVEKHEKDAFIDKCKALDSSAARELRRFMREFVATDPAEANLPEPSLPEAGAAEAVAVGEDVAKPKKKAKKSKARAQNWPSWAVRRGF